MSKIARFAACLGFAVLVLGSCMIDLLTDTYSVFYDGNGSTAGTVPLDPTNYEPDQSVTVLGNSGSLALEHYAFAGWSTAEDGSGTLYTAGQTFAMGEADVTLYAAWALNDYLVVFDANGGTGTMAAQPIPYKTAANLTPNAFSRGAYKTFAGWGTSPGGPVVYADGASYTMDTVGATLYAQWNTAIFNVNFVANGGTGTMAPQSIAYGSSAALTANTFSLSGSIFVGWAGTALGVVAYENGESYTMATEGATLYAVWVSVAELDLGVLRVPGDSFGMSVAVDGDYAIVGANNQDGGTFNNDGAAYIYHRTDTNTWDAGFPITSPNSMLNGCFGYSVGISGDYAIVGASNETVSEKTTAGAAYIFRQTGGVGGNTWGACYTLNLSSPDNYDSFGCSVGISGDYAIVGAFGRNSSEGAAYIFHQTAGVGGNTWDSGATITATGGGTSDGYFGWSVGISGDYAVVGAYGTDSYAGAAYVFNRTGGASPNTWDAGVLIPPNESEVTAPNQFGWSVAIDGDYAVVGAVDTSVGAAYVYNRSGPLNVWDAGVLIASTLPSTTDSFGHSVAIDGSVVVVGAPESGGQGAAYVFNRTGTNAWDGGLKIIASDPEADDWFGFSVGVSGDYAIVGAYEESNRAGKTYIYTGF